MQGGAVNNLASVALDAAPSYPVGSIAANATVAGTKSEMYLTPEGLFGGREVALGEVVSMSYWTKTGGVHSVDPRDWFLNIYTKPYAGDASTPTWYGDRIGTEPYFSAGLTDPANTWNQWTTGGATNKLRFFESTAGAPGANFGTYADPDWATLIAGNALSGDPYTAHKILYFSIQTGSAWANGFTGRLDGLRIELTDGSVATVNFEPDLPACTTVCYADAVSGNNANGGASAADAKKTIQAAINQVSAGGEVRVLPGTYNESAPGSAPTSLGGTYQFGLFFGSAKPGITLMGVTAADAPIANAAATLATINTDATNNFGTSGIFVEAANTTIRGVTIGPNLSGDNKTIEVVADNFTLQYSATAIPDGGAVYLSEFDSPAGAVSSYHILDNQFTDFTQIAISSGAGQGGPVSGREIKRNIFALGGNTWPSISFNGTGGVGGVPWFTKPVGGAIITNNSFSGGGLQYIRARGTYTGAEFDWHSYWQDNTYDKGTVALLTEAPFDVRSFSYVSGPYTFTNVRRIGTTIQGEVDNALAGDEVLVKAGTYPEDVVINKASMKLKGAGADLSVIEGPKGDAVLTTLEIPASSPGVLVDGFTVTRNGNNPSDWNGALNNQGVAIYGAGSTMQYSKITGNRNGVFLYGATNVTIKNNIIDFNRTGLHLVNDVSGLVAQNNVITNNWTMGVLFRDESNPNNTGAVTITDNDISGNWYSQVEGRSPFSAPALNVTGNWLGTTSPTVFVGPAVYATSASGEPGYSAQIPVLFGGGAVPPLSSPTIAYNGLNGANPVGYIPFRCSGADASPAFGFQPAGALSNLGGSCDNQGPLTSLTPPAPAPINTAIFLGVSISDLTTGNSLLKSYTWSRDGGTPTTVPFATSAVTQSFTINVPADIAADVDNICVKGTDLWDNIGPEVCVLAVWYDPTAGFVTGGGWINSPAGAYPSNSLLTGRANFGFVSKYAKGQSIPSGNTEFQFSAASLSFKSTSFAWLVVSGARAQYKGVGTINGAGNYNFMLTAIDGQVNGGGGVDKFRIKIWDSSGTIVYDNMPLATDTSDPTTVLGGGNIMIHK
jgi:parallel beta-helix repeat protein